MTVDHRPGPDLTFPRLTTGESSTAGEGRRRLVRPCGGEGPFPLLFTVSLSVLPDGCRDGQID